MRQLILIPLFGAVLATATAAQQTARPNVRTETGSISGQVRLADGSGQPVRRASMHLQNIEPSGIPDATERIAITDDTGAFAFGGLPAGRYVLWATKNAYVPVWYGSKRPGESIGATSFVLTAGKSIAGIALMMPKGAVITGTVFDAAGKPAAGAHVSVLQSRPDFQTGLRTLVAVGSGNNFRESETPVTDNRGVYRIYGLPAGSYVVKVEAAISQAVRRNSAADWQWLDSAGAPAASTVSGPPPLERAHAYAPVYAPGTAVLADAVPVTVAAGEERSGIDARLTLVPTAAINGTVRLPDGLKMTDVLLIVLLNGDRDSETRAVAVMRPDADGAFSTSALAPGSYSVIARQSVAPSLAKFWGRTDVTLAGLDQSISIALEPSGVIKGHVSFDGAPPANLAGIQVSLVPSTNGAVTFLGAPFATTDAQGAFSIQTSLPGPYRFTARTTTAAQRGTFALRSVTVNGRESIDMPFEIKPGDSIDVVAGFTSRLAELSGSLIDASGRAAPDFVVIVFSADPAFWMPGSRRIAAMRPGLDGKFKFSNLPAGEYWIGALTDVEQYQWFDPTFLESVKPATTAVTLTDGMTTVKTLQIGSRY